MAFHSYRKINELEIRLMVMGVRDMKSLLFFCAHLSCRLSTRRYTLQFDFSIFGSYHVINAGVAFDNFWIVRRDEDRNFCIP